MTSKQCAAVFREMTVENWTELFGAKLGARVHADLHNAELDAITRPNELRRVNGVGRKRLEQAQAWVAEQGECAP